MSFLRIILAALAVWRVTHLLQAEDGPFHVFERGRNLLRRVSLAGLADCFYCLSLWMSAPFAFVLSPSGWSASAWMEKITFWLALSGAAILINRLSEPASQPALYYEEPYREEKSACSAVEMPEGNRPRILKSTQARSG